MSGTPLLLRPEELAYKAPKPKRSFKVKPPKFKLPRGRNLFILVFALIIIEGAATEGYLLMHHKKAQPEEDAVAQQINELNQRHNDLVKTVSSQIAVPPDEDPTVATVTDPNALKNQAFFSEAEVGDKILMYRKNEQAFLFRPSIQQVIAQAQLKYQDEAVAGASTSAEQEPGKAMGPGRILVRPEDSQ